MAKAKKISLITITLKISGIYMLAGVLWILLSDRFVSITVSDKDTTTFISIIKGLLYVLLSGGVIFSLVLSYLKKIKFAQEETRKSFEEVKSVNDELAVSEEFSTAIIEKMLNAFALHKILLDDTGKPCDYEYIDVNPAFEAFTCLKKKDVIGKRYKELIPKSENEKTDWIGIYGRVAITGEPITIESYTDAFDKWVTVNAYSPLKNYFITVFSDISNFKRSEVELKEKNEELTSLYEELTATDEELRQQFDELSYHQDRSIAYQEKLQEIAYHDNLTGLPNRLALYENLLTHLNDFPEELKALLFVDADNFKFINDTMGHSFGDKLIIEIGKRLFLLFNNQHLVYRLGGDEFIICCCGIKCLEQIVECAEKIIQSFTTPFDIEGSSIYTTVSIGISTYPEDGTDPDGLMRSADIAMYKAKSLGKNSFVFYKHAMQEKVKERMMVEKYLRCALQNNEFLLYYQPQLDIITDKITGFEALLRWNNPELGFVSPLKFIGIAEETHLIISIGEWVLRNACYFLKNIQMKGCMGLTISVNISIIQLVQEDFVDSVLRALEFSDLLPKYLELEITESIFMESYQAISNKLHRLKEIGVNIALDDFGQGYSSLSCLKQLPINTLKIDKSFIDSINSDENNNSLTGTIVMIGRQMGLTIIAEGVEKQEQMDYLINHHCHKIQGFLISKPMPPEEVIKFYEEWNNDESRQFS